MQRCLSVQPEEERGPDLVPPLPVSKGGPVIGERRTVEAGGALPHAVRVCSARVPVAMGLGGSCIRTCGEDDPGRWKAVGTVALSPQLAEIKALAHSSRKSTRMMPQLLCPGTDRKRQDPSDCIASSKGEAGAFSLISMPGTLQATLRDDQGDPHFTKNTEACKENLLSTSSG